jgi:hypothetical protein
MPNRQYRTLVELRAEMRAMIGAGSAGTAAGVNTPLIDTHLRNAQTLLYWTHDWAHLRAYELKTIGANQTLIDYPAAANPDRIRYVSVLRGTVWSPPLKKGITPQMYTYQANVSWPQRWEPYEQIEIWPMTTRSTACASSTSRRSLLSRTTAIARAWTTTRSASSRPAR